MGALAILAETEPQLSTVVTYSKNEHYSSLYHLTSHCYNCFRSSFPIRLQMFHYLCQCFCLGLVSDARIKDWWKPTWEGRVYWAYKSSSVHCIWKSRQEEKHESKESRAKTFEEHHFLAFSLCLLSVCSSTLQDQSDTQLYHHPTWAVPFHFNH